MRGVTFPSHLVEFSSFVANIGLKQDAKVNTAAKKMVVQITHWGLYLTFFEKVHHFFSFSEHFNSIDSTCLDFYEN